MNDDPTRDGLGIIDWQGLDALSDHELGRIMRAALTLFRTQGTDNADAARIAAMPPRPLASELEADLRASGVSVSDIQTANLVASHELAVVVLNRLAKHDVIRAEIERIYRERQGFLAVDPATIAVGALGGALLLLVIKLKSIEIGNTKIEFYDIKSDIIAAITKMLGK